MSTIFCWDKILFYIETWIATIAFLEFLEIFPEFLKLAISNAQTNDVTFVMSGRGSLEKHKIYNWITIYVLIRFLHHVLQVCILHVLHNISGLRPTSYINCSVYKAYWT